MAVANSSLGRNGKLDLLEVLDLLVEQGYLSDDNRRLARVIGDTEERRKQHALEVIAERNWTNERKPEARLDLTTLTAWLAERPPDRTYRLLDLGVGEGTQPK